MQDISGSSQLQKEIERPLGAFRYTISCMHCSSVSLAQRERVSARCEERRECGGTWSVPDSDGSRRIDTSDPVSNWYLVKE
jgi:hypothetical protein